MASGPTASQSKAHLRLVADKPEPVRRDARPRTAEPRAVRSELEDEQLVALAQSGDAPAFELLYRRHASFALNLAVRIQGGPVDVEDIVHDAFIKAFHRIDELRDLKAFRSWLGAIVVRLVRTRIRRRRLLGALGLGSSDPIDLDSLVSPEAGPEARAELAQVYALMRALSADERVAWALRYVERHPLEEVAVLCGCSLATAKRRIARAQRFLSDHYVAARVEPEHA
jgi:RNA polymerase sigma-70 factor (ECF subfamily)